MQLESPGGAHRDTDAIDRTVRRRALAILATWIVFLVVSLAAGLAGPHARVAAGYAAKVACTARFAAGRSLERIRAEELDFLWPMRLAADDATGAVTAWMLPWERREAIFRDDLGAVLVPSAADASHFGADLRRNAAARSGAKRNGTAPGASRRQRESRPEPWPLGDAVDLGANAIPRGLAPTFAYAFEDSATTKSLRTRAVVVVVDGRIVAERYADGLTADSVLPGWSMTKSVTNAMVGILVGDGRIDLLGPANFPEWQDDSRATITLENLLRMESGLDWSEDYADPSSDVLRMLYTAGDMAGLAARSRLATSPATRFQYASGSSLLVQRCIRQTIGDDAVYHAFARERLFEPIGARSAILETDAAGTFVGSSYAHMTARDWARFGLLYLRDGTWPERAGKTRRILPEGFVAWSTTQTASALNGEYGAHWWLNRGRGEAKPPYPKLPRDLFLAAGHEGQYLVVVPSRQMVIVRLGLTQGDAKFPLEEFVAGMLGG